MREGAANRFSPHFFSLPFLQEAHSEIHRLTITLLYWGCSLHRWLGAASSSDWRLPEGRALILLTPKCVFLLRLLLLEAQPCLPPLTSYLPRLRLGLLPQTGDLPRTELGVFLLLPRGSPRLRDGGGIALFCPASVTVLLSLDSPLIFGHLSSSFTPLCFSLNCSLCLEYFSHPPPSMP